MKARTKKPEHVAEKLYREYYHQLTLTLPTAARHHVRPPTGYVLTMQPPSVQKAFMTAAHDCIGAGAQSKRWVRAQFVKFEEYSQHYKRKLVPQPAQLFGLAAQHRYVQYVSQLEERKQRADVEPHRIHEKYKREYRKLQRLVRVMRVTESDVLIERPEEFTPDFLDHLGVWDLVCETYAERTDG